MNTFNIKEMNHVNREILKVNYIRCLWAGDNKFLIVYFPYITQPDIFCMHLYFPYDSYIYCEISIISNEKDIGEYFCIGSRKSMFEFIRFVYIKKLKQNDKINESELVSMMESIDISK